MSSSDEPVASEKGLVKNINPEKNVWSTFWVCYAFLVIAGLPIANYFRKSFSRIATECKPIDGRYLCHGGGWLLSALPIIGYAALLVLPLFGAVTARFFRFNQTWLLVPGLFAAWIVPYGIWRVVAKFSEFTSAV